MNENDFWNVIANASDGEKVSAEGLVKYLENLSSESIVDFDTQLQERISELGTCRPLEDLRKNPEVEGPISDDGLEYLLAGVVSRGREVFEAVLLDSSLLRRGQWLEDEDLLRIASGVIEDRISSTREAGHRHGTIISSAEVFHERYPIPPKELEGDFPVDTFGWIMVDVQDSKLPAIEILRYDDGDFTVFPEFGTKFVRYAFQEPAVKACSKLRSGIDFRSIPGLVLNINITIGDHSSGPEVRPICSRNGPFDLWPGVALWIDRRDLPESNSPEFERFGASVIFDALEVYFAGQERELGLISLLRGS